MGALLAVNDGTTLAEAGMGASACTLAGKAAASCAWAGTTL